MDNRAWEDEQTFTNSKFAVGRVGLGQVGFPCKGQGPQVQLRNLDVVQGLTTNTGGLGNFGQSYQVVKSPRGYVLCDNRGERSHPVSHDQTDSCTFTSQLYLSSLNSTGLNLFVLSPQKTSSWHYHYKSWELRQFLNAIHIRVYLMKWMVSKCERGRTEIS